MVVSSSLHMTMLHDFTVLYPEKFVLQRELTDANVIPGQYIVVMNHNQTQITTHKNMRRYLFPENNQNIQKNNLKWVSSILDGDLDEQRGQDFRVQINDIYTHVFNGFSATLSPLAAKFILDDPNVAKVEPNMIATIAQQLNPPWNLDRIDQKSKKLDNRFDTNGINGADVSIFILDTGVNTQHAEFVGRVQNSVDFVKDGKGPRDCNGHGTHCASTALGTRWGVAKKAWLNNVRVLGCNGSGSWSSILSGLDWSVNQIKKDGKIGVISMSLGGGKSSIIDRAVANAVNQGAIVVVAAGNENSNTCRTSPANEPLAIAVGATTQNDERASFSNFGQCVDLFAPGVSIRGASHLSTTGSTILSGTSMACPQVSGSSALEIQKMVINKERVNPNTVREKLLSSSTRGVLSNLRGGPNLLLRVPTESRPLPFPTPRPPNNCATEDNIPCVFPFIFQGVQYDSCTTDGDPNSKPWCSTRTDNANKHLSGFWGHCQTETCQEDDIPEPCLPKTNDGSMCSFPFVYKGVTHLSCTSVDDPAGKLWCSTETEPDTNKHIRGKWGHCSLNCDQPISDAPTFTPTSTSLPVPTPSNPPTLNPEQPTDPIDCELFDAVNDVRIVNNLTPLTMDTRLYEAARKHAIDMGNRGYFAHVSPDGSTPAQRVSNEGYQWTSVAENIAAGYTSVEDVVNGWVNSDGHYKNIRCTQCTRTGIARVNVPNSKWTNYYVQVFASGDDDSSLLMDCEPNDTPRPPTSRPSFRPTPQETMFPTNTPTIRSTVFPTSRPSFRPTRFPSVKEPRNEDDDDNQQIDATCKTIGNPNTPSQPCIFPFVYKSVLYTHCTTVDHNQPWCATATNIQGGFINGKWGICDLTVCLIKPELCQLQVLNAPWSNAETRLLSNTQSFAPDIGASNVQEQEVGEQSTQSTSNMSKWLFISIISSCVCNILLSIYVVYLKYVLRKSTSKKTCDIPRSSSASL